MSMKGKARMAVALTLAQAEMGAKVLKVKGHLIVLRVKGNGRGSKTWNSKIKKIIKLDNCEVVKEEDGRIVYGWVKEAKKMRDKAMVETFADKEKDKLLEMKGCDY